MRVLRSVLFAVALVASSIPAMAVPPVLNGDVITPTMPTFNVKWYGAKGDGTTDDTAAINNAISAVSAAGGGTVYFPRPSVKYLMLGAMVIPYAGTQPTQKPIRLTGDGGTQNGYWASSPINGGSILDMQYSGVDTLYKAKIDTRGAGILEIDHLTLEDTAADNFLFIQTTNTTLYVHDNGVIGNPAKSGTTCVQDAIRLGQNGYNATGSISSGSTTLTATTSIFNSSMVGWNVVISGSESTTIAAYVSPTQVTLANASPTTVSGANVNYFGTKTSDPLAPFQGYGTVIARNYYSHIQRGVIWGTYANNVVVENETYSNTTGSGLAQGSPYYFEQTGDVQDGNVIRGGTVEVTGYPYVVSLLGFQHGNLFDGLGAYDENGTTLGIYYFNANASNNSVIEGQVDSTLNPSLGAGTGAYLNTIVSHGIGSVASQFSYAVNSSGAAARGKGYQIDGKDILYSNTSGTADNDLNLKTPGATGTFNFYQSGGALGPINSIQVQISGLTALAGDGGTGIIVKSAGPSAAVKIQDSAGNPTTLSASSISASGTTNTFNGWSFNPNAVTDFYWGSPGTTAATIHFRTNGYNNADTAAINSAGAWQGGHNTCSSSSGNPCSTIVTCSLTAATACTATAPVPSSSICMAQGNASDTTTGAEWFKNSLSTNTLTVTANVASSQTSTVSANVHCL